ncbi:MAG TPA: hypothetical protein VKF42_03995 [Chitinivibrionales bacterium]|jgi:hypothetical protein|nr:hypothetical protein [Chitinivibrionales bacterium]
MIFRRSGIVFVAAAITLASGSFTVQAQTWDTLHKSEYSVWVTPDYNLAACNTYRNNLDSVATELDKAIPLIVQYLGIAPPEKPQRVEIDSNTAGMGGWSSGGDVGYFISDFYGRPTFGDGLRWIRGVIIGEVINSTTGAVSGDWPRDWWCDDVWYFPGFVAGELLKQTVDTAFGNYWLTSEKYPTYPVYNIFKGLLTEFGWTFYKNFFAAVLADTMHWGNIGANPSSIKTDYVIAYLSLAAGRNLGATFDSANVAGADAVEIAAIMSVEERLQLALSQKLKVATAWTDFRNGNYAAAKHILDSLGVAGVRHDGFVKDGGISGRVPASVMVYSLKGQVLYSAPGKKFDAAMLNRLFGGQTVVVRYVFDDGLTYSSKRFIARN